MKRTLERDRQKKKGLERKKKGAVKVKERNKT